MADTGRNTRGTGIAAAPPSVAFLISKIGHDVAARLADGLAPLGIPPNRMVLLVDDLEERKLVRRERHPTDRRAHALSLTASGKDLLGQAFGVAFAIEEAISGGLDSTDRATLLRLLGQIAQQSSSPPGVHSAL